MAERKLQAAIAAYLESKKGSVADPDSMEVAISCVVEAFGLKDEEKAGAPDLLEVFQKYADGPSASASSSPATDVLDGNPLYKKYLASLEAAGYFGTAKEGTAAHNEKLQKAKEKFLKQQAGVAASGSAAAPSKSNDEAGAEAAKAKGNEHVSAGRHREAEDEYTKAIELAPTGKNVHIYYCNRAAARTSLGDAKGAVEDAKASIAANPSFAKAHSRLGTALVLQGKYSEAITAFEKCLELDPSNDTARENMRSAKEKLASKSSVSPSSSSAPSAAGGAGGAGGGLPGGLGGMADLLNNPMLSSLMSNPQVMQAAQQMMKVSC
jgi:small glutamine-rich tetratricopeptide repeat-containing protein alpha